MARKRTENAADYSEDIKMEGQNTRAKKYMKSANEKLHESGRHNCVLNGREERSPPQCSAEVVTPADQRLVHLKDPAQEVPTLDLHSRKELQPSGKLKLQLFPIDEHTRKGLEKDGFHPYLELTMSSRKKISSVLKRLHRKWGSSHIAQGDPVLYPYDKLLHSAGYKWTANSSSITAGDVYAALGSPFVYRLRYGWTSVTENNASESQSLPSFRTTDVGCGSIQKGSCEQAECANKKVGEGETNLVVSEKILPDGQFESKDNNKNDCSEPTLFLWDDLTNLSIGGLLSEASLRANINDNCKSSNGETTTLWVDNLSNISIGALISEASLDARLSNREQKSIRDDAGLQDNNQSKASIRGLLSEASSLGKFSACEKAWNTNGSSRHQSSLISDSLDAFLINRMNKPRGSSIAPSELNSSILDAEDTCHAFSFGNNLSSRLKRVSTTSKRGRDGADSVTVVEKGEEGIKEGGESENGKQLLCTTPLYNQESSLGLSGIKWGDYSLGQFDIVLSSFNTNAPKDNRDSITP